MDIPLQIRDFFHGGFNKYCLSNYEKMEEGEEKKEAEEYIYQIYMINNMKHDLILGLKNEKEKNENLYMLYLYYKYYYMGEKENVLTQLKGLNSSSTSGIILKSRILFDNDLMDECFELLDSSFMENNGYIDDVIIQSGILEVNAAKIFFLLYINRNDLVKEMINDYLKMNDEIPIVKIVLAIFNLYNDNCKEAFLIFDDLESLFSSTINECSGVILNGKGVSNILNYEFTDAKEFLKSALKNEEMNCGDVIYNLITCSLYLYELEEANEYLNKLYNSYPSHDSLNVLKNIDYEVDNFVAEF
ncbi:coatomer subunit epsilon, putative (SEC28) [Plasmodium ovale wallikeri]|uniref:Coatomer subunit epsilon, putative n=2 Tax=Plasmodium ovale TaxID=36330 RepID=A0A1C3KMF5_PLAOA|nr:coatomer subunit epsilon, putative (SEC28) [Plasmodium ovale wallikeri]SBT30916.1 coatomer subunit epsilon, putative (SEC28) [Plasmodium ovale wallikeri]SBT75187.1 coatomer subunit epsilon, putative [Plasmodium ovale]